MQGTLRRLAPAALAAAALLGGCGRGGDAAPVQQPAGNPTTATPSAADPSLVTDPATGDLLLTWIGGDSTAWQLWFARSTDGGATWSAPVQVTTAAGDVAPHGESSPRLVAATGGRLAAVWPKSVPVPGRQWPASIIRFARSMDGGRHWEPAITLNDDTTGTPRGHNFHGAAWVGDSGFVAAWLDERSGGEAVSEGHHHDESMAMTSNTPAENAADQTSEPDAAIYLASSGDFGRTWQPNRRLWNAVCPCCRVSLARGADGAVTAAWRQHFPGNVRDVVVAPLPVPVSSGNASAGSAALPTPERVHRDDWVFPGCPHAGPSVAMDSAGAAHVVWYTGKQGAAGVFYTRVAADGKEAPAVPLASGTSVPTAHAALVLDATGGALAAYDVDAKGTRAITLARLTPAGAVASRRTLDGSSGGTYPQVALGRDGTAVVAWTTADDAGRRVQLARVRLAAD